MQQNNNNNIAHSIDKPTSMDNETQKQHQVGKARKRERRREREKERKKRGACDVKSDHLLHDCGMRKSIE